jgi:predicted nuclease with TOPRIM domain|tara:strand:+ start:152 stop:547 length:396 start_codon:yes stop_codon:yes gene_type:complete
MIDKIDKILAEISAGELVDKITILEIKQVKISNKDKLDDINKELSSLNKTMKKFIPNQDKISKLVNELKDVNLKLWDIEDGKRIAEKNNNFGKEFIELARNVYKFNDKRAKIKLAINIALGSNIKEVKSYE